MAYTLPNWFPADLTAFDDCDENGACQCNDIRFNAKTVISSAVYGILADPGYLETTTGYSRDYLLQMAYDENQNVFIMSDMHSQTDPPTGAYDTIADASYVRLLLLSYLGWDKYNARFVEQVVMYGTEADQTSNVWYYSPGTFNCLYHNGSGCDDDTVNFSNITIFITYQSGYGTYFTSEATYPIEYSRKINWEDDKPLVDGVYKSYYFKIFNFTTVINGLPTITTSTIDANTWLAIEYVDVNGDTVYYYGYTNEGLTLTSSGANQLTVTGISSGNIESYDFSISPNYSVYEAFISDWFTEITALYALQHYQELQNATTGHNTYDAYVAEEGHLVTYNLRENVVDSINDCEIPCERFSFDTWVALMQKKMSAKDFFCKDNFTEASRILFTTRERCKNCNY